MPITIMAAYCPRRDPEFEAMTNSMLFVFGDRMHRTIFWGRTGGPTGEPFLDLLASDAMLYVLAHIQPELSAFNVGNQNWTAGQLADRLQADGLASNHRDITLLTCHAALSAGSKIMVARFRKLQAEKTLATQRGDQRAVDDVTRRYNLLAAAPPTYKPYTNTLWQMAPLAAEFARAMGVRGYRSLRVTSYTQAVAQCFNPQKGHEITLEGENRKHVTAATSPKYLRVWNAV
jgi:hypothetical protein